MNNEEYFEQIKSIQKEILDYLEENDTNEDNYQNLNQLFIDEQIFQDRDKTRIMLHLLKRISENHNRQNDLIQKIERIISDNEDEIKQIFSNYELFEIFKNQKIILLFLFENKIIIIDEIISKKITEGKYIDRNYPEYFYPEIKDFIDKDIPENSNEDKNREKGENENYIFDLIREDSIDEFIIYINRVNYPFNMETEPSIFETNSFLLKNKPTLIEYAAFFGSIQIFKYLYHIKAIIRPSIWLYAIHSNKAEIINFIEESKIMPEDTSFQECLRESIKCHHNEVANYILNNYIDETDEGEDEEDGDEFDFDKNIYSYSFHYHNYAFFPEEQNNKYIFFYACKYNYLTIVKNCLENKNIDINGTVISTIIFNTILKRLFFYQVLISIISRSFKKSKYLMKF